MDRMDTAGSHKMSTGLHIDKSDAAQSEEACGHLRCLLNRFAAGSSVEGISRIHSSSGHLPRRILWSVFLLLALSGAIYLIHGVFAKYMKQEKTTVISLKTPSSIGFPSVTICNVNPIRKTTVNEYGASINNLLDALKTPIEANTSSNGHPPAQPSEGSYDSFWQNKYGSRIAVPVSPGKGSSRNIIMDTFGMMLDFLPIRNRTEMGHQSAHMILSCMYQGAKCDIGNFTQSLPGKLGNCYTFNSAMGNKEQVMASGSGSRNGLNMVVFIENDEYIDPFAEGKGLRVAIHEFNTQAHPMQSAVSVSPNANAYIALKMSCAVQCPERAIYRMCNCYMKRCPECFTEEEKYKTVPCEAHINLTDFSVIYSPGVDRGCIFKAARPDDRLKDCDCRPECMSETYSIQQSSHSWPSVSEWDALRKTICNRNATSCGRVMNITDDNEKRRFLESNVCRLTIYFEDLQYKYVQEVMSYDITQCISDLGGAIGLCLGASFFTICEILDFLVSVLAACYEKGRHLLCTTRKRTTEGATNRQRAVCKAQNQDMKELA